MLLDTYTVIDLKNFTIKLLTHAGLPPAAPAADAAVPP